MSFADDVADDSERPIRACACRDEHVPRGALELWDAFDQLDERGRRVLLAVAESLLDE